MGFSFLSLATSFFQSDIFIFKNFRVTKGTKLQFRAEAVNIFNLVNLGLITVEVDNVNGQR